MSHPIQYQSPLFRRLARSASVEVHVLFLSAHGIGSSFDPGFGQSVSYDVPLLDGFQYEILPNLRKPDVSRFTGLANPRLVARLSPRLTDAVLIHGWGHVSEWLAALTSKLRGLPYLLRGEARADLDEHLSPIRRRLKRTLLRPLVAGAAGCLAIGERNRDFYCAYGANPDRIFDAPYSVDTDRFERAGRVGRLSRDERLLSLGLDPRLPVILFAAKLQPWKRPLDVAAAVSQLGSPVNLLYIGEGPLRGDVERAASSLPNARVLGFVNQQEIGLWYGVSDVFVLPSEVEPWGLAVNEAMAAGAVPVVAEVAGCAPDLVTKETGRSFTAGDIAGFSKALRDVLSDSTRMHGMASAAQERAKQYGIEATARGIEAAATAIATSPQA